MDAAANRIRELRSEGVEKDVQHLQQLHRHILGVIEHHQISVHHRPIQNALLEVASRVDAAHQRPVVRLSRHVEKVVVLVVDASQHLVHQRRFPTALGTVQDRRSSETDVLEKLALLLRAASQASDLRQRLVLPHDLQQVAIQRETRAVLEEQQHVAHPVVLEHVVSVLLDQLSHCLLFRRAHLHSLRLHRVRHVSPVLLADEHLEETVSESGREGEQSLFRSGGNHAERRVHDVVGFFTILVEAHDVASSVRGTQLENRVQTLDHVGLHCFHGLEHAGASGLDGDK